MSFLIFASKTDRERRRRAPERIEYKRNGKGGEGSRENLDDVLYAFNSKEHIRRRGAPLSISTIFIVSLKIKRKGRGELQREFV